MALSNTICQALASQWDQCILVFLSYLLTIKKIQNTSRFLKTYFNLHQVKHKE